MTSHSAACTPSVTSRVIVEQGPQKMGKREGNGHKGREEREDTVTQYKIGNKISNLSASVQCGQEQEHCVYISRGLWGGGWGGLSGS